MDSYAQVHGYSQAADNRGVYGYNRTTERA